MTEADRRPWRPPVGLVGDSTAASERAADPGGWALSAEVVGALHEVIAVRRHVLTGTRADTGHGTLWRW